MKSPRSERFGCDFLGRVRAANTRLLPIATACLVLWARAAAGQAPTVTLDPASQVTGVSAIISGTVNANGLTTWAWFRWGTTTSYSQTSLAYQLAPVDTTLAFSNQLSFLSTNTTYHYQLVATNSAGQAFSPDMTLTTSAYVPTPVITINPAINVTDDSATVTGTVNPIGYPVSVYVFWVYVVTNAGTINDMGNSQFVEELPAQSGPVPVSITITNLRSNTAYQGGFSGVNSINLIDYSTNISFTTLFAPTAITDPAANITVNEATLLGSLNPNGFETTYYFEWGTSTAYGNTTGPSSVAAQNTPINVGADTLPLNLGTTYHYQLVASNSTGIYLGGDMSFATDSTISIQGQVFTYSTNKGTVTITAYAGPGGALTIPSTIAGLPVTAIADSVFAGQSSLTSVTFPDTLTSLGASVFDLCTGLNSITLPGSLTNLGSACLAGCTSLASAALPAGLTDLQDSVFSGCSSLLTVTIPNSVTNIGPGAFAYCGSLTNVIIGNGVLNIGSAAFYNCSSLTAVSIPASTVSIAIPDNPLLGSDVVSPFAGCTSLIAINVDPRNSAYSSAGGVLLNKDQSQVLLCPPGKRGNYVIPDSVIVVGASAFANCSNLANVMIGGSVAELQYHAFDSCVGLTNITIPDSVTNIQDAIAGCFGHCVDGGVFGGCTSLTNVVIGKGLTYLGLGAFTGCSNLLSVYFKGDAPALGFTVVGYEDIFGADSATVYYLPGTTGWGSTLTGLPALLWNPQIQTGDASFGVRLNGFGFNITGTANIPVALEASTNPGAGSWVLLQSCTLTNGSVYFGDQQWSNYPNRLYRIRSP